MKEGGSITFVERGAALCAMAMMKRMGWVVTMRTVEGGVCVWRVK